MSYERRNTVRRSAFTKSDKASAWVLTDPKMATRLGSRSFLHSQGDAREDPPPTCGEPAKIGEDWSLSDNQDTVVAFGIGRSGPPHRRSGAAPLQAPSGGL